ncbi:class I SAM-dependent methyltransferase (plasmid) [Streptomyces sp. BI20]|uniref:class I SAM-dependent methyltransferase n=1 Tax=Streptomyces sp. BI20 TaxID=3403460 RepID=UPI003C71E47B
MTQHAHAQHAHGSHASHASHAHPGHSGHAHVAAVDHAEILDLDAEVFAEHLDEITAGLPLAAPPRRILDLGSGTGAGTLALLDRFPDVRVTAVDASSPHLGRLRVKARAAGVDDRVHTVEADLDAPWPELAVDGGAPELVWASASLHHLADPRAALRRVRELLAPGGLFVVVELAGFPRFLPPHAPADRPGLEDRAHAASERAAGGHLPHRGADWGPLLVEAGFAVEEERGITVHVDPERSAAVRPYAVNSLTRLRASAAEALDPADLAALDRLLDPNSPDSLGLHPELAVRTERTVWTARRP